MGTKNVKQSRRDIVGKYFDKLDEVWAYGKAHSPNERNGQEFKNKMKQYRQELYEIVREKNADIVSGYFL